MLMLIGRTCRASVSPSPRDARLGLGVGIRMGEVMGI